jgi:hypothetical protein
VSSNLREPLAWYIRKAIKNIAEEVAPCASIIIREPRAPNVLFILRAAIRRPICPTEEYAIIIFKSLNRKHKILTRVAPTKDTEAQIFVN